MICEKCGQKFNKQKAEDIFMSYYNGDLYYPYECRRWCVDCTISKIEASLDEVRMMAFKKENGDDY